MTNNVSLLPNQAKFRLDQIRLAKRGKKIALVTTGIVSLCLVVVWGLFFINKGLLTKSEERLLRVQFDFGSLGEEVALNQEARYRLKLASGIMKDRFNYGSAMKAALDFLPEETEVDGLDFEGGNTLNLKGCLDDYELMDAFEKKIENKNFSLEDEEDGVRGVRLNSLGVKDGSWCFNLGVEVEG